MAKRLRLLVLVLAATAIPVFGQTKQERPNDVLKSVYIDVPQASLSGLFPQVVVINRQVVNDFQCISAPGNPPTGLVRLYCDSGTGNITCLTSAGGSCFASSSGTVSSVSITANQGSVATPTTTPVITLVKGNSVTVTFSATPTFAYVANALETDFFITITGNVTSSTLTGGAVQSTACFFITQSGGPFTFVWPTTVTGGPALNPVLTTACFENVDGTNWQNLDLTPQTITTLTTLGDTLYGGAGGALTRLAGPTTPNGVPQYKTSTPSGGVATAPLWSLAGVPVEATNPATLLVTDRANYLNWTSGSALALPAVSGSFASNLVFHLKNTAGATLTITPNAGASDLIDGSATATLLNNFAAFVYQDSTTAPGHWFTSKYPTFAAFGNTCANALTWSTTTGFGCSGALGTGTVTSVGLQINGGASSGIFAVTGSPVTTSGNLNYNLTGTSGGIPYFSSGSVLSSSAALTANFLVLGGGAGSAPVVSAISDDGTALQIDGRPIAESITNEGVTGTTINLLAKLSSAAPSTAILPATTDTGGVIGIVVNGAGTIGSAKIAIAGQANCIADNATTAGDYVQIGTTTAGRCKDAGASYPTSGQVLGRFLATCTVGNSCLVTLFSPEEKAFPGTVTTFSSGNLSPLFTTSVATPTTTPALSFSLSNAAAGTFLGNNTSAAAGPAYVTLSAINPQTSTYQVLASDFSAYKTITVASGTFTITLVASGIQPANGQYISIVNYGTGVVTIARSGQNINGGTSSLVLPASAATSPTSAIIWSDGANYFAGAAGGPSLSALTAALASNTLANGNNPQIWNWAQTTSSQAALTLGETTAATGASDVGLQLTTLTTSTAIPLQITQGANGPANTNAPAVLNVSAAAAGGLAGASNAGSVGAPITLLTGAGSAGGATTGIGGTGGAFTATTGAGGAAGGTATNNGGNGGAFSLTTGAGGNGGTGAATAGSGGGFTITLGAPGTNSNTGTTGAVGQFQITGNSPASTANTTGVNAGTIFNLAGVTGGADSAATGTAGNGSVVSINSGNGGAASGGTAGQGGAGGALNFTTGNGGASTGTAVNPNGGNAVFTMGIAGIGGSGTGGATGQFQVTGTSPASTASAAGLAVGTLFNVSGVTGGASSNAAGTAGIGSVVSINSGAGGAGTGTNAVGGAGGAINLTLGNGGASAGTGANSNGGGMVVKLGAAGSGGSGAAGVAGKLQVQNSGGTTQETLDAAGNVIALTSLQTTNTAPACTAGTAGAICLAEGTAFTNVASTSGIYADSTAHEFLASTNGSNTATPGMLVRRQPSPVHQTGQTAAISTATLCAAAVGACNVAGQYHIHFTFIETGTACATPGTGGVTFLLTWTDSNATAHSAVSVGFDDASAINAVSQTFHFQTTLAAAWGSGDFNVSTNGSVIQYATGYTACTAGTGTYQLDASVTRLQ